MKSLEFAQMSGPRSSDLGQWGFQNRRGGRGVVLRVTRIRVLAFGESPLGTRLMETPHCGGPHCKDPPRESHDSWLKGAHKPDEGFWGVPAKNSIPSMTGALQHVERWPLRLCFGFRATFFRTFEGPVQAVLRKPCKRHAMIAVSILSALTPNTDP